MITRSDMIWPADISPYHWSQAGLSLVITWMGDLLGKPGFCWKRC